MQCIVEKIRGRTINFSFKANNTNHYILWASSLCPILSYSQKYSTEHMYTVCVATDVIRTLRDHWVRFITSGASYILSWPSVEQDACREGVGGIRWRGGVL